MLYKTNFM